jgi:hypothetical protein
VRTGARRCAVSSWTRNFEPERRSTTAPYRRRVPPPPRLTVAPPFVDMIVVHYHVPFDASVDVTSM